MDEWFRAFFGRCWNATTGLPGTIAKKAWLKIWRSLDNQKLVFGLAGVTSVEINKSSSVRLKCPKCEKASDFTIERLQKGNPRCNECNRTFAAEPFLQNLDEQLRAAVRRI